MFLSVWALDLLLGHLNCITSAQAALEVIFPSISEGFRAFLRVQSEYFLLY